MDILTMLIQFLEFLYFLFGGGLTDLINMLIDLFISLWP